MFFLFAQLFLLFLPFQFAVPLGSEGIPLLRLVALGLIFLWGIKVLTERKCVFPPLFFLALILSWLFSLTFSLSLAEDISLGIRKLIFLWNLLPLTVVWALFLDEQKKLTHLIRALIIGGALSALVGMSIFLAQFVVGVEKTFHLLTETALPFFLGERLGNLVALYPSLLVNIGGETWLRATAFFPDPHVASFFFGIIACLAWGLFLDTRDKLFLYSGNILLLVDILTFSRGGYLGLLAALGTFFFVQKKEWGVKPWVSSMALLPLLLWFGVPVYQRFFSVFTLADASSLDRLALWGTAWETILYHPWVGLGLGNYAEWIHPGFGASIPYYAHNLYLDIATEGGLISLFLFLGLYSWSFVRALRRALQGSGLALGVTAALALYFTHSFFETALFSLHVTVLLSLLLVLPFTSSSKKTPVE